MCFAQKCLLPFELDPPTPFWNPAKWVVVVTFDWGSYWHKVNIRFQGYPTWPYLARPSMRPNYCIYNGEVGGPLRRGWDMFGQITFSNISFYWPQDQESTQCHSNFQKKSVLWKTLVVIQRRIITCLLPNQTIFVFTISYSGWLSICPIQILEKFGIVCAVYRGTIFSFFGLNFVFLFNISNIF